MKKILMGFLFCIVILSGHTQSMHIEDGDRAYFGGNGHLMLGFPNQERLSIDYNLLQAYEDRDPSVLHINTDGGSVKIGNAQSTTFFDGNLIVENHQKKNGITVLGGKDANLSSGGFMQLGLFGGLNLVLDNNEIQARINGQASPLYLNHDGGALFCRGLRGIGNRADLQYNTATGEIGYDNSSRRFKTNISRLIDNWEVILKARPVKYDRPASPGVWEYGYIAEEMDSIGLENLVMYDQEGIPENFNYRKMIIYTTEVLKLHEDQISQLEARDQQIDALRAKLDRQEHGLVALHKRIIALERSVTLGKVTDELFTNNKR